MSSRLDKIEFLMGRNEHTSAGSLFMFCSPVWAHSSPCPCARGVLEPLPLSCVSSPCSLAPSGAMGTQLYLHDFELLCLLSPTEPLRCPSSLSSCPLPLSPCSSDGCRQETCYFIYSHGTKLCCWLGSAFLGCVPQRGQAPRWWRARAAPRLLAGSEGHFVPLAPC